MHKYITLFFSVALFCCGCKSNSVPGKYIQPKEMAALLVQIHLIDGTLYNNVQVPDSLYKYGMGKYLAAFERAGVDSAQFRKSMVYYASEPDKLLAVYDTVDLRVKALTDSVNMILAKKNTASRKADSLKTDSIKKANLKPKDAVQKADSTRKANKLKRETARLADSVKKVQLKQAEKFKRGPVKKLINRRRPDAVPLK